MADADWPATGPALRAVLPQRGRELDRLRVLVSEAPPPTVTVVGKYNHGKSRLLNELIGSPVFAVADRRETVALADHEGAGLRWLDAPGLDADVDGGDDRHAEAALWQHSDIRLFVHTAREGELDAAERALVASLREDAGESQRETLHVLTQIDQLADDETLAGVASTIAAQIDRQPLFLVSATRYRQGVEGGKPLLLARSGVPVLQAELQRAVAAVAGRRRHETARLIGILADDLRQQAAALAAQQTALSARQTAAAAAFAIDLEAVLAKAAEDLRPLVEVSGPDLALQPDSFETMFKVTPAKLERNRIQVAYSRVCIAINAVLTGHGVVGLPAAQRTRVASLDTVIVAVLGVSVKFRADLRRLFCEAAGRRQLAESFTRYFERADDRVAMNARLASLAEQVAAVEQARQRLTELQRRADAAMAARD